MMPLFPIKKPNVPNLLNNFKPELEALKDIAKTNVEESIQHITKIAESKDTFTKTIAKEVVKLANEGPNKTTEIVNRTAEQINSIAQKTLKTMKDSENPIVQKTAETVEKNPVLNPEEAINKTKDAINQTINNINKTQNNIEKEIIKEVVKTKVEKNFFGFFKDMYAKIKQFICNLLKFRNNS